MKKKIEQKFLDTIGANLEGFMPRGRGPLSYLWADEHRSHGDYLMLAMYTNDLTEFPDHDTKFPLRKHIFFSPEFLPRIRLWGKARGSTR